MIVGKDGGLWIGANKVAELSNWSIEPSADTVESTNFDSDGWKEFLAGLKEWSASCEGNFKFDDINGQQALWNAFLNGTALSVRFGINSTGPNFTGDVLVTAPPVEVEVGGKAGVSFELQGTGPLTYNVA